jgi:RND family efflux transporter MFP subunit
MHYKQNLMIAIGLVLSITACKNVNPEGESAVRKVKTAYVKQADTFSVRQFSSVVEEKATMNMAFRVAGKIEAILVKEGDFVKKGQLIAVLDNRDYKVQANVAKAQYQQVKAEAGRVTELYGKKSVSANDYDKATAGLKMVTEQWNHALHQLEDTKLYASVSGYVQSINYEPGELINTGYPLLSLMDVSSFQVSVDVPVDVFLQRNSFTKYTCAQSSIPNKEFGLSLLGFHKKANANQLYTVDFALGSINTPLAPGMDVEVDITIEGTSDNPFFVPLKAVFNEAGKTYVWVYVPKISKVEKRMVHTDGLYGKSGIRIVSGLKLNEQVVVAGIHSLKDKQTVELLKETSKSNKGGLL